MKSLLLRFLLLVFLSFVGSIAVGQVNESHYRIYSIIENKEVGLEKIVEAMADKDVVFFGEEHDDSVGHYLEKRVMELLYERYGNKLTLSLEMFDRDVQLIMNEYLQSNMREKHFVKDARAWKNYKDYRAMVELAKQKKLHVICANASTRYTNLAGREGQQALLKLPKASRANFAPVPYDTAGNKYYEKLTGFSGHSVSDTSKKVVAPVMLMPGFSLNQAQSLWDATMAYSIAEYVKKHKGQKVMQVNGRFHSDERFAAVEQLKKYSPQTRTLIISCGRDDAFSEIDWKKLQHLGDFIIVTDPAVPKTF